MSFVIHHGDALTVLRTLPAESVNCCVTSPPYWGLRDYGVEGQIGLEETPDLYVWHMVQLFREVRRVLRDDGTFWLNLGDAYAHNGPCGGGSPVAKRDHAGLDQEPYRMTDKAKQKQMAYRVPPGLKPKDLVGIPWRVAFALQADGWYLRSDIIWAKPAPMPESVTDRPTRSHEHIFLLAKSERYYYDAEAIAEPSNGWHGSSFDDPRDLLLFPNIGTKPRLKSGGPTWGERKLSGEPMRMGLSACAEVGPPSFATGETRNKRDVWTVNTKPFAEAHFATFPEALITPCILAGCPEGGTVLDPFSGAGTTGLVAKKRGRDYIGIELNPEYVEMSRRRLDGYAPLFGDFTEVQPA